MDRETALANALIHAWRRGRTLDADTATRLAPADTDAAYRVQSRVGEALGWFPDGRPRAWKMGFNPASATPTAAPVPNAALLASPARLPPGTVHTLVGIEVELALRVGRPLRAGCTPAEVEAAIVETVAAIEVCDVRAQRWQHLPPLFHLADQQMHRWLVLGSSLSAPWEPELSNRHVCLEIDGTTVAHQRGGHPLANPLHFLPWLATHADALGHGGLQAGDVIATGTWTGLHPVPPGARVRAEFAGIGEVALTVSG